MLPATIWKPVDLLPEELSKGKLVDINEESGCNEKDEDISEEVTLAINFTLKELSEIFHDIESTKDKSLEADPSLKGGWQFTDS